MGGDTLEESERVGCGARHCVGHGEYAECGKEFCGRDPWICYRCELTPFKQASYELIALLDDGSKGGLALVAVLEKVRDLVHASREKEEGSGWAITEDEG